MKTELSVECREEKLRDSVTECLLIMKTVDISTLELKVKFYLEPTPGHQKSAHRYLHLHKESRAEDLIQIYELKKKLEPDNYFTT